MSLLTDFLLIMGAIVVFLAMVAGIINWLSRGFWNKWLRVRLSKGKRWLIRVWTPTGTYYTHGVPDGEFLTFKDKLKKTRSLQVIDGSTYKVYGVDCVEVDETTNGVRYNEQGEALPETALRVKGAFHVVPGFDAVDFDNRITRAYNLGKSAKNSKEKAILFLIFLIGAILLFMLYLQYNQAQQVAEILAAVGRGGPVI